MSFIYFYIPCLYRTVGHTEGGPINLQEQRSEVDRYLLADVSVSNGLQIGVSPVGSGSVLIGGAWSGGERVGG